MRGQGMLSLQRVEELHNLELITARDVAHTLPRHIHETLCFSFVDSGARDCRYKNGHYVITPGQVQIIPPGETHTCSSAGGRYSYRVICFNDAFMADFTANWFEQPVRNLACRRFVIDDAELYGLLSKTHDLLVGTGRTLESETMLIMTLAHLSGYFAAEVKADRSGGESRVVQQVKDYLAAQFSHNVSINDLSLITGLSPYYLIRVFTAAVGLSPHAYLNHIRVSRARRLLEAGRRLADAALAVGFADQSHFQRWFKKIIGITPGQYRQTL